MENTKHPIEDMMNTTMERMRDMVDVDTVVGEPIVTGDGSTVIPISAVSFGFVSGGGEYRAGQKAEHPDGQRPFAGGTGAGISIKPVGFLVQGRDSVRLLPAQAYAPVDRMIELAPQIMGQIRQMAAGKMNRKQPQ